MNDLDDRVRYREQGLLQIIRKMNTIDGGWRRCGHEVCRRERFCCGTPFKCVLKPRKMPPPEQGAKSIADLYKFLQARKAERGANESDSVLPWRQPNGGLMTHEEFAEWAREIRALQRADRSPQR